MSEEWTTTRLKAKELEDLHQLKVTIQATIGKTITLGEAITYALNHVKTGWYETVDVSKLANKIEISLDRIYLEGYPPRIGFSFVIDNRNTQDLFLRQFTCKPRTTSVVEQLGEKTVIKKVNFGAVQKRTFGVIFDLSLPSIEALNQLSQSGDITLEVEVSAYFGVGDAPPTIIIERRSCSGKLSTGSWKRHMDRWIEKYPLTFKCFTQ